MNNLNTDIAFWIFSQDELLTTPLCVFASNKSQYPSDLKKSMWYLLKLFQNGTKFPFSFHPDLWLLDKDHELCLNELLDSFSPDNLESLNHLPWNRVKIGNVLKKLFNEFEISIPTQEYINHNQPWEDIKLQIKARVKDIENMKAKPISKRRITNASELNSEITPETTINELIEKKLLQTSMKTIFNYLIYWLQSIDKTIGAPLTLKQMSLKDISEHISEERILKISWLWPAGLDRIINLYQQIKITIPEIHPQDKNNI